MSGTRAVVEEFFRRAGAGEFGRLSELFAEEVDWNVYGAEEVPWVGRRTTRAEVADFFDVLRRHLEAEEFAVHRIVVEGEDAIVLGDMRQTVVTTGDLFVSPFAFHLTVHDGLITRYIPYEDSLNLARAFGVA
ncbi:nuclear transport factor 2 family protein [Embleya sp. AB8]|uniref:nuclear transport factor 2 family protein n=1 Tax=Embleya sp. AB8 TaxID=3156304 RepID=UPI003C766945